MLGWSADSPDLTLCILCGMLSGGTWGTAGPAVRMGWGPLSGRPGLPWHLGGAAGWWPPSQPCHVGAVIGAGGGPSQVLSAYMNILTVCSQLALAAAKICFIQRDSQSGIEESDTAQTCFSIAKNTRGRPQPFRFSVVRLASDSRGSTKCGTQRCAN